MKIGLGHVRRFGVYYPQDIYPYYLIGECNCGELQQIRKQFTQAYFEIWTTEIKIKLNWHRVKITHLDFEMCIFFFDIP